MHQLDMLTEHPGWKVLVRLMQKEMDGDKRRLLNGFAKDYDDYLKTTGLLIGVHAVLDKPALEVENLAKLRDKLDERDAYDAEG